MCPSEINKKCFNCKKVKSLNDFYVHKGTKDNHLGKCKECVKIYAHNRLVLINTIPELREKEIERCRIKMSKARKQGKIGTNKAIKRASSIKYSKNNKIKRQAHRIVHRAIESGKLVRLPCEKCNSSEDIEAHHDNYNEPLNVRWLCPKHHAELHNLYRKSIRLLKK